MEAADEREEGRVPREDGDLDLKLIGVGVKKRANESLTLALLGGIPGMAESSKKDAR